MTHVIQRLAANRASWVVLAGAMAALGAGGCQILSGLNDLNEGGAASSTTSTATSSSSNASTSATMCGMGTMIPCMNPACFEQCGGQGPCEVSCPGDNSCSMGTGNLACVPPPPNEPAMDCNFYCGLGTTSSSSSTGGGGANCAQRIINCPKVGTCRVTCEGMGSCDGTTIQCGDGACLVDCISGGCGPNTVNCGPGLCDVGCSKQMVMMMGSHLPTINKGPSCNVPAHPECI